MKPNIKETIILTIVAMGIVTFVILIILLIFWVSGNQSLLEDMLQVTVEGGIAGATFSAAGPLGMWILIFYILKWSAKKYKPPGSLKLFLCRSPETGQEQNNPLELPDPHNTKCWYTIWDGAHPELDPLVRDREARIQTKEGFSYINIEDPGVTNPFEEVKKYMTTQEPPGNPLPG